MGSRVNYPDLDLMKLLMAFFVVEIHTRPLRDLPAAEFIVEGVEVLAVPFLLHRVGIPVLQGPERRGLRDCGIEGRRAGTEDHRQAVASLSYLDGSVLAGDRVRRCAAGQEPPWRRRLLCKGHFVRWRELLLVALVVPACQRRGLCACLSMPAGGSPRGGFWLFRRAFCLRGTC